jgi:hypothetical protein
MTDDTPRMPARIWADRSDDDLPQYADTPFGIWWHDPRDGYAEYVRKDLYDAERRRAEEAEAERGRLRESAAALCVAIEKQKSYGLPAISPQAAIALHDIRAALRQHEGGE